MTPFRTRSSLLLTLTAALLSTGCLSSAGVGPRADAPLALVPAVDLERFAGLWYVIESMPTPVEAGAHNATEHYALGEDGDIAITFQFRKDAFDGELETLEMRGWPINDAGSEWRVQPVWPVRLAYLILELDHDEGYTVVGHPSKRFVWIMARQPALPSATLRAIRERLAQAGYDAARIQPVPQQNPRVSSRVGTPAANRP